MGLSWDIFFFADRKEYLIWIYVILLSLPHASDEKKEWKRKRRDWRWDEMRWAERIKLFSSFSFVGISFTYIYIYAHTHRQSQCLLYVRESYKCASINKIHSCTYTQCALSHSAALWFRCFFPTFHCCHSLYKTNVSIFGCCCTQAMSLKYCFLFSLLSRCRLLMLLLLLHNKKNILIMLNQRRWDNFFVLCWLFTCFCE